MSKPWIVFDPPATFEPGRALVMRAPLTCRCGATGATLSHTGHTIRCLGCGCEEVLVHTGGGEAVDLRVAGYDYAVPDAA